MKATKTVFAMKALILAVPFVLERELIRDLAYDLVRTRQLARRLSVARAFTREITHVYNVAYTSALENDREESAQ